VNARLVQVIAPMSTSWLLGNWDTLLNIASAKCHKRIDAHLFPSGLPSSRESRQRRHGGPSPRRVAVHLRERNGAGSSRLPTETAARVVLRKGPLRKGLVCTIDSKRSSPKTEGWASITNRSAGRCPRAAGHRVALDLRDALVRVVGVDTFDSSAASRVAISSSSVVTLLW